MKNSTKEWLYILLLAIVNMMYFFVDGMADTTKAMVTFTVFIFVVVLKFVVKTTQED